MHSLNIVFQLISHRIPFRNKFYKNMAVRGDKLFKIYYCLEQCIRNIAYLHSASIAWKCLIVLFNPSSSPVFGCHLNNSFAFVMSGCLTFGSSTGSGLNTILLLLFVSLII